MAFYYGENDDNEIQKQKERNQRFLAKILPEYGDSGRNQLPPINQASQGKTNFVRSLTPSNKRLREAQNITGNLKNLETGEDQTANKLDYRRELDLQIAERNRLAEQKTLLKHNNSAGMLSKPQGILNMLNSSAAKEQKHKDLPDIIPDDNRDLIRKTKLQKYQEEIRQQREEQLKRREEEKIKQKEEDLKEKLRIEEEVK